MRVTSGSARLTCITLGFACHLKATVYARGMRQPPLIHIQRDKPVTGYKALLHTLHSPRLSTLTWDQQIIERNYRPGRFGLYTTHRG